MLSISDYIVQHSGGQAQARLIQTESASGLRTAPLRYVSHTKVYNDPVKMRHLGLVPLVCAAAWGQPEVHADRTVTFRLTAPKASEVTLSGEFLKGSKPLGKDDKGDWHLTVGPLDPEIYHYNFTIDGVKTIDPGNPNVKFGSTAQTIQSILEIPANGPTFYDGQLVPHGEIHTLWYDSKVTGTQRRLTVYTPPGYETSQMRYPVLYLFHGANADETAWTRLGHVNLILDNLLAAKKAKPFVVVMPFGYGIAPGMRVPAPSPTSQEVFAKDLLDVVIPMVQSRYRVLTDRTQRAIAGLSMGGGESLSIGLNHVDRFAYVAGFSAAVRAGDFEKSYPEAARAKDLKLLWISCGKDDSLFAANQAFTKFLADRGAKFTFRETEGAHTWMVWRRYLNELAPLLFQ
jgi:enterochelin esterase family protein